MAEDTIIFIMSKHPTFGQVKTRLGKYLGFREATCLYLCFLKDTIDNVKDLGFPFLIYYTPKSKKEDFQRLLGDNNTYIPQTGCDMGERLFNGFELSLEMGFNKAIALASDTPDLPKSILQEAIQKLGEYDSVIGPCFDGGYYLIGLRKEAVSISLFEGIKWSTETVFRETMNKIKERLSYHVLASWGDVDLISDLKRLRSSQDPVFHKSRTWKRLNSLTI